MLVFKFTRRYAMAHRLIFGGSSPCATPHGHNEFVTVECSPIAEFDPGPNMSVDFWSAKNAWHNWIDNSVDHAFQLGDSDPMIQFFQQHEPHRLEHLLITSGDPTTEMLAMVFARKFRAFTKGVLELRAIHIEETPTNTVSLLFPTSHTRSYVDRFLNAPVDVSKWWDRADSSINNFQFDQQLAL